MPEPGSGDLFPTLDRLAPLGPAELLQLLLGKQRQDWERGERVPVEQYLERARAAGESWLDEDGVLDLLYNEIVLREEHGDHPNIDEYRRRFPEYADQLEWQFAVHEGLRDCSFWQKASGPGTPADGPLPGEPSSDQTEVGAGPRPAPGNNLPTLAPGEQQLPSPHAPTVTPAAPADDRGTLSDPAVRTHRPARPPVGQEIIPGYEVLGELGRGGMGVVYKARQVKLRRLVALKMILAGAHARPDDLARFKVEAEAVARLQHPNIIQIHEIGEHGGLPYFSLEFCAGGSLASRLNGTPLPAPEAAQLIETLARAMHAAHQQQVIHRDLKPANILLTADGRPKITDFGLAKKLDEGGHTHTGEVMGTPSYMAPEQARGRAGEIGPHTDVYSLGAILYELLTGRAPFRAATPMETLHLVLSDDPVSPSRLQPRTPRDLVTVCLKCLQKEPKKRYATALELAEDLERFRGGETIRARPVGMVERGVKWARQRPAVAGLLATLVTLALTAFVVLSMEWRLTEDARRHTAEALAERETQLYFNHVSLAEREWLTNHVARVEDLLGRCPPELRHWEWRYLHHLCHSALLRLPGRDSVAFSPSGRRLAVADGNDVHVRDADTGTDILVLHGHTGRVVAVAFGGEDQVASASLDETVRVWDLQHPDRPPVVCSGGAAAVALSRDGSRLASAGEGSNQVFLRDAQTGAARLTLECPANAVTALAFAPDGKELFAADKERAVHRWATDSGQERAPLLGHSQAVTGLAVSPDGKLLAASSEDETVLVWDLATGKVARTLLQDRRPVSAVAFSPDGSRLASAAGDFLQPSDVTLWNVESGRPEHVYRGHRGVVRGLAFQPNGTRLASADGDGVLVWDTAGEPEARVLACRQGALAAVAVSPDGRLLASAGADGTVTVWDEAAGREVVVLRGHEGQVAAVTFCGAGLLASAGFDGTVRVWDLATGKEQRRLDAHTGNVCWGLAASADGTRLVSGGEDGAVKLWDRATGKEIVALAGHLSQVSCVAFSPDGRLVASAALDRSVKLWDTTTGAEVRGLQGHGVAVSCLAFSRDGTRLASGGGNDDREEIKVWDVRSGAAMATLRGRTGKVCGVAFSGDGRRLASAEEDHTVRVYETAGGQELLALPGHRNGVTGVAFGPGDRWLVSSSLDGTLRIWEAPPEE
jgi:WD40 repeat protein/tRNA A-37 threonylcarbamoyl transferase component Bud32